MLHVKKNSFLVPFYPWIIWAAGAFFFCVQAMMRSLPNAISFQLQESLMIPERNIALLGACFYGGYAVAQIPLGISLDYWGPRRVMVGGALVFALGTLLFSYATTLPLACMARVLTGMGGAVAFIGTVRLGTLWFTPYRLAIIIGITMGIAKLGGAFVNALPWAYYAQQGLPWHRLVFFLSLGIFALATLLYLVVRDDPSQVSGVKAQSSSLAPKASLRQQIVALRELVKRPTLWLVGGYAFFFYTFVTSFADVFASTFLKKAYVGITSDEAGKVSSMVLVGMCVGSPLMSYLSNVLQTRRLLMRYSAAALGILMISWAFYVEHLPLYVSQGVFLAGGVLVGAQALVFVVTAELMPKHLAGSASGVVNTVNMMSGLWMPLFLTSLMSYVMGPQAAVSLVECQYSVYILGAGALLACLLTFFFPESFAKTSSQKTSSGNTSPGNIPEI